MKRHRRRWSDHDRHCGPFTYSQDICRRFGAMLCSGDDEYPGCCLRLHFARHTFIIELPAIVRPHKKKVQAGWDADTIARLGRDWYFDVTEREFGAILVDDAVHIHYGAQTHDSRSTRSKCWFVPWMNWRHVRHSLYGIDGSHFATQAKGQKWAGWYEIEKACPSVSFEFDDFDGERIVARTHIEEREWRFGTGWFKWLSAFRQPRVRRSLDIDFSKETGQRKGSWKGGTVGTGIEMRSGELHEAAFRRYCAEHRMKFLGAERAA